MISFKEDVCTGKDHGVFLRSPSGLVQKFLHKQSVETLKDLGERSREVAELFMKYHSLSRVAEELQMSTALVSMYLPYQKVAYDLDEKSANARRRARWKERVTVQDLTDMLIMGICSL